jgi:3-phosphoglycerate kinase
MIEADRLQTAREAMEKAKKIGVKLLLPVDHVVTSSFNRAEMSVGEVSVSGLDIEGSNVGIDVGPKTIEMFKKEIGTAATVLWNGPMGIFEVKEAAAGTFAIAEAIANSRALSIIGGGDSGKAIRESGYIDKVSFVSTGGGASLEFLEGTPLPGVEALMR